MANQHKEHNTEKYIQWVTALSLTIRVYLRSFSCCCLSNLRNPAKLSEGHPRSSILVSIESACNFLL